MRSRDDEREKLESRGRKLMKWKFDNKQWNRISFALADVIYSVKVCFYSLDEHSIIFNSSARERENCPRRKIHSMSRHQKRRRGKRIKNCIKCGWEKNRAVKWNLIKGNSVWLSRPSLLPSLLASMTPEDKKHLRWISSTNLFIFLSLSPSLCSSWDPLQFGNSVLSRQSDYKVYL